jgi:uncharacterized membrane protein
MESKAKIAGHAVHPMLIVFPLGLLATAVGFDLVSLIGGNPRWTVMAFYLIGVGVVAGVLAAVAGAIDWWAIPRGTRAKRIGLLHGGGNLVVVALFALSWLLRRPLPAEPPTGAIVAGLVALGIALVTAWLGGELVERLGVAVDAGAHLDAPSSLSSQSATGRAGDRRRTISTGYRGIERRVAGMAR